MAKTAYLQKISNGFMPVADMNEPGVLDGIRAGDILLMEWKKPRDIIRHRKYFALLNLAYENWQPPEVSYNNVPAEKSFERFRNDITCGVGYYDVVVSIKGEVRVEPKSIAFSSMGEEEFYTFYNKVVNFILQQVMTNYKREDIDNLIEQIIRF